MNDDKSVSERNDALSNQDYSTYVQLATDIFDQFSRGRTGFGAFRHFSNIFRETARLVLESGFLASPQKQDIPLWFLDEEWLHFHFRKGYPTSHKHFINQILSSPSSYDPPCLWALFWAMAKAEHEFLIRYVPFWSHEERLTGHLISQLVERIESFSSYWTSLNDTSYPLSENQCPMQTQQPLVVNL
jgi:hypothetical protein